jgi:hypothetical protein
MTFTDTREIAFTDTLEVHTCCVCGVRFAVPERIIQNRRQHAGNFYCPNGHCIGWNKSEADKLREQLDAKNRELTAEKSASLALRMKCEAVEREAKRRAKRIHAGVCPCCNRTFSNLARHMKTKHPDAK